MDDRLSAGARWRELRGETRAAVVAEGDEQDGDSANRADMRGPRVQPRDVEGVGARPRSGDREGMHAAERGVAVVGQGAIDKLRFRGGWGGAAVEDARED